MIAPRRIHHAPTGWATLLCGLFLLASAHAKVTVVTLSQLVDESDTIVYGSFEARSKAAAQSPSFVQFIPKSLLRGKDISAGKSITFCNQSGERSPDLSRMTGSVVLFANKQLECYALSHGDKSIIRVKAGHARTAAMDDQPQAQPLKVLLKKIATLVARPATR